MARQFLRNIASVKRLLSIILLIVLAYNLCGVFVVFKYHNYVIRKEMKMKIKAGVPEEELAIILVNAENEYELHWKHSREFKYRGVMYDVVRKERKNDNSITYYCVTDTQETQLFEDLNNIVFKESNAKHNNKNNVKRIVDLFSSILVTEKSEFNLLSKHKILEFENVNSFYISPNLEGLYAPPQV